MVPRNRRVKKPVISVAVVRKTEEATAGSIFSFLSAIGIKTPTIPATNIVIRREQAKTRPRMALW